MTIAGGLALAGEAKASITYDVSLAIGTGGAGIAGTITTDGKNGVIGASDITAWDLTGTGNGGSTLHIVNGPSVVEVGNNTNPFNVNLGTPDLTADANHIYFNFSATDGGYLAFQAGTNLFGGQRYIGFGANNNSDVYQGFSVVPGSVGDSADIHEGESRNQIIASVPPSALVMTSPRRDGTNFVFNFGTVSNQSYSVWANANLATTNWVNYTNLVGDGYIQKITTSITNGQAGFFYRLSSP
jgi:hypothetical protein